MAVVCVFGSEIYAFSGFFRKPFVPMQHGTFHVEVRGMLQPCPGLRMGLSHCIRMPIISRAVSVAVAAPRSRLPVVELCIPYGLQYVESSRRRCYKILLAPLNLASCPARPLQPWAWFLFKNADSKLGSCIVTKTNRARCPGTVHFGGRLSSESLFTSGRHLKQPAY